MRRATRLAARSSPKASSGWTSPNLSTTHDGYAPPKSHTSNPQNMRKDGESWSWWVHRVARDGLFESRAGDDRMFGGDHGTAKGQAMNELKNMDKRIATFNHPELAANVLKTVLFYDAPNGTQYSNDYLDGRIVGLLLFSDTEKSKNFMETLSIWSEAHKEDMVIVAVSCCHTEYQEWSKRNNFLHLTHKNGAMWVKRDLNFKMGFPPLPRLYIVDGSTGMVISRSGYTAVKTNPTTCFDEWVDGGCGHNWYDWPKTWFEQFVNKANRV
jgi:hypothetical protein